MAKKNGNKKDETALAIVSDDLAGIDLEAAAAAATAARQAEHEDLQEDLGRPRLSIANFDEVVGAEHGRFIIFHHHRSNAYWKSLKPSPGTRPDCMSVDGKSAEGDNADEKGQKPAPGAHDCRSCKQNKFGSSKQGKGKACKNKRILFVHRIEPRDKMTPVVELVQVASTSLNGLSKYLEKFLAEDENYFDYETVISVVDPPMGSMHFERGDKLTAENRKLALAMNFKHRQDHASVLEAFGAGDYIENDAKEND